MKVLLLACLVFLNGCFLSPTYWMLHDYIEPDFPDDMPYEARKGWKDGCKSGVIHDARPSMIRYLNTFYIDPDLIINPVYRDAWYFAHYQCNLSFGYLANKNYAGNAFAGVSYLDPRGDYIAFKK